VGTPVTLDVATNPVSALQSTLYPVSSNPRVVAAGDLDHTGRMAFVMAGDGVVTILRQPSHARQTVATVANPTAISLADFDGDGRLDIAVADMSGQVAIHLNQGSGQFTRRDVAAGAYPSAMVVADFNRDGIPDIAVTNRNGDEISILLGRGDGSFQPSAAVHTGGSPRAILAADLDGDGKTDLVTVNALSKDVRVHLGSGDGAFRGGATASAGESPVALASGDFNGDGRMDLAVLDDATGLVRVMLGSTAGTFVETFTRKVSPGAVGLTAGDVNGDGHVDLAISSTQGIAILTGNGDGTFADGPIPGAGALDGGIVAGDFEGDGTLGLAAISASGGLTVVSHATCSGAAKLVFTQGPLNPSTPTVASTSRPIIVQVQDSAGHPLTSCSSSVTVDIYSVTLGFNLADLGISAAEETRNSDASGNATFTTLSSAGNTGSNFALVANINSGAITAQSSTFDLTAQAPTLQLVFTPNPPSGVIQAATRTPYSFSVTVTLEDGSGKTYTSGSGPVTLTANGPSALGGGTTAQMSQGIAQFPGVSVSAPGSYTLTASIPGAPSGTSAPFTVTYSSPILNFATQPQGVTAGAALNPVSVQVLDTSGNPSHAAVDVTVAAQGPGSFTPSSTTTSTSVNGVATFSNLVLNTAGSYTLAASASGLGPGASASFAVAPGSASALRIVQQPWEAVAGISFAITAQLQDSFGNVASSNATVSLAVTPGSLAPTTSAVNGVATFSNLAISATGAYTPSVSSAGVTGATGSPFSIVAAPPAVAATSLTVPSGSGSGTLIVTVPASSKWTAARASGSWLSVTPASGTGSGMVTFSYTANSATSARTGTLTIAGQTVTITQQGTSYTPATVLAPVMVTGLDVPRGIGVNGHGAVYVADTVANALRSLNPATGHPSALSTSGMSFPLGVALDAGGNAYLADTGTGSVKVWSAAAPANPPATLVTGFNHPSGIAVDWNGDIYVADTFNGSIKRWTAATGQTSAVVSGLSEPAAVAVDGTGNVFFTELGSGTAKKWNLAAQTSTTLAQNLNEPHGVAVDGRGDVYIAEAGAGQIRIWNAATQALSTFVSGFSSPVSVAADARGTVYIADASDTSSRPAGDTTSTGSVRVAFAAGAAAIPMDVGSGTGSFQVSPASVSSGAKSSQAWLTITGSANGVVTYSVQANTTGASRTATITVGGQQVTVTQSGS
jgi:sugar lactone lactonase YvrE